MVAKSQKYANENLQLSLYDDTGFRTPIQPHLLYADAQFGSNEMSKNTKRLVIWCQSRLGDDWDKRRVLKYLAEHQQEFLNCLSWLAGGAVVEGDFSKDLRSGDLLPTWRRRKKTSFLQLHGVTHCNVSIRPQIGPDETESGRWHFSGLDLGPRQAKDPLDPICWHLLYLLALYRELNFRECQRCRKFFTLRTKRKIYCRDLCRAKAHAKTPKQWRDYMRQYRKTKKELKEGKRKRALPAVKLSR